MGRELHYTGLSTKIRAMDGALFKVADYHAMAEMKNTDELVSFLKTKPSYQDLVDGPNIMDNRAAMERCLGKTVLADFKKIYLFADQIVKNQIKGFFVRQEIYLLIDAFRGIHDGNRADFAFAQIDPFLRSHIRLPVEQLAEARDVREMIERLQGTPYGQTLKDCVNDDTDIFDIEMYLENYYYTYLWNLGKQMTGKSRMAASGIAGSRIDMMNILYIYRARNFFHLTSDLTYTYLLPVNYRLLKKDIIALTEANGRVEFKAALAKTKYAPYFNGTDQETIEKDYKRGLLQLYRSYVLKYPDSPAIVWTHLFRKRLEMENIISMVENMSYGLTPDERMEYMVIP